MNFNVYSINRTSSLTIVDSVVPIRSLDRYDTIKYYDASIRNSTLPKLNATTLPHFDMIPFADNVSIFWVEKSMFN